jgi:acyl dehydratase
MTLDLSTVGYSTKPYEFEYDWKAVVLYALGIGAKKDELDYLYEAKGPKVYPTFAVVPVLPVLGDTLAKTQGNLAMVVHGGQIVRLSRPIPPEGKLSSVGKIRGIYDMKKMAQVVVVTETQVNGEPCFETEWSIIFRGAGGFGGQPPPRPDLPGKGGGEPDFTHDEVTSPEQALLYRLSGDLNPLHADPDFANMVGFPQGPILHGLCSYGFVARAVIQHVLGGDAKRVSEFGAQFRKPVWPGETIQTRGYRVDEGVIALEAFAGGRPDPVITNAWARISS